MQFLASRSANAERSRLAPKPLTQSTAGGASRRCCLMPCRIEKARRSWLRAKRSTSPGAREPDSGYVEFVLHIRTNRAPAAGAAVRCGAARNLVFALPWLRPVGHRSDRCTAAGHRLSDRASQPVAETAAMTRRAGVVPAQSVPSAALKSRACRERSPRLHQLLPDRPTSASRPDGAKCQVGNGIRASNATAAPSRRRQACGSRSSRWMADRSAPARRGRGSRPGAARRLDLSAHAAPHAAVDNGPTDPGCSYRVGESPAQTAFAIDPVSVTWMVATSSGSRYAWRLWSATGWPRPCSYCIFNLKPPTRSMSEVARCGAVILDRAGRAGIDCR